MATSRLNLKTQLLKSTNPGSILATDTNNEVTHISPTLGADHLWFYDHSATALVPLTVGTNLSITGTTLNASAGAGGYSEIQEEGVTVSASNTKINFVGSGITAADAGSGVTSVTIASFLNTLATAGAVNLTSHVTGTLPVANGGTGATTLTGILQGNGTSAVTAITNSSTVGQVLRVTGASTYAWGALDLADTDAITGDLPFANLAQGSALSVLGVAGNATADNASIAAGTDNQVLRRSGTSLGFGAINLASANAVTGVLDETNGGTGQSTITTGDILYGSSANTLSKLAIGAATTYLKGGTTPSWATLNIAALSDASNVVQTSGAFTLGGTYTFSNNVVLNGTPSLDTHAVTKGYVDGLLNGLSWKDSVDVATTANITLSGEQTIDGVTTSSSRVLVKNQSTTSQNGIYVSGAGAWTRATDMDAWSEVPSAAVFVEAGTTQADTAWVCTSNDGGTLGTTAITFVKFSSAAGIIDGSGAANKVAYWSDTDTLTSTTNFHYNGTQLGVGTDTPAASTVVTTKGTGTGNSTYGLLHQNSSGTQVFRVADDGTIVQGTGTTLSIYGGGIESNSVLFLTSANNSGIRAIGSSLASSTGFSTSIESVTKTYTSGDFNQLQVINGFAPTSGTGTYKSVSITPTINQTGGANGITRGVLIAPTLTAASDFRALEITANSSHYSLWSTAGKVRLDLGSDAQGDLLVRGSGGNLERLAAGSTSGHVLTSNGAGAAPTYQALPATGTTVTRGYITGSTSNTFDLDLTGTVKDIDGNNAAFTIPTNVDQFFVYLNGQLLQRGGSGNNRDYDVNTTTHVLTLQFNLVTTDELVVIKFS